MPQTPKVKNLAELMHWIADEYHDGAVLPIADKIRVSPALVGLWSRGQTVEPKTTNLQRLAAAYDLDFIWLLGLIHGRKLLPIRGGSDGILAPPVAQVVELVSLITTLLRSWARPLLATWCPA